MSKEQKTTLFRILFAAVLLAAAWIAPLTGVWKLLAFIVPYPLEGGDVPWSAVRNILHGELFDEKFLMTIATIGALIVGEYPEAVAVMLILATANALRALCAAEACGNERASRAERLFPRLYGENGR